MAENRQRTGSRQEQGEADKKAKLGRQQELVDLRQVLATPAGRRVFYRLLSDCGVYRSIYDHSGSKMAYNAGQQDFGHYLLTEVNAAGKDFLVKMTSEAQEEKEKPDA